MPQNIDDFNQCVIQILGRLYEIFPKEVRLCPTELPFWGWERDELDAFADRYLELTEMYSNTAFCLLAEGYIRGKRYDGYIYVDECALTVKGLAALQRVPDSIKAKHRSVGDFLIEIGKDGIKAATKEAISMAVKTILSAG